MTECIVNALMFLFPLFLCFVFVLVQLVCGNLQFCMLTVVFYKSDILQTYQYKFGPKLFKMASGGHIYYAKNKTNIFGGQKSQVQT